MGGAPVSKGAQAALRRARLRELAGPAEPQEVAPPAPLEDARRRELALQDLAGPPGPTACTAEPTAFRPTAHVLELSDADREELGQLADRGYAFAREVRDGLDGGERISEAAAWNARDALEDDTRRPWPSKLPMATGSLSRKLTALFNEVP